MRVLALVAMLLALAPSAHGADWRSIKPTQTSEAELIGAFGAPDDVTATFPWSEWSAKWKKRPNSSGYVFRYSAWNSQSSLLVGPGGPADDVAVDIHSRQVFAVAWHYHGPSAVAAAARLRADLARNPDLLADVRTSAAGVVWVKFAPDDSDVEVRLELK